MAAATRLARSSIFPKRSWGADEGGGNGFSIVLRLFLQLVSPRKLTSAAEAAIPFPNLSARLKPCPSRKPVPSRKPAASRTPPRFPKACAFPKTRGFPKTPVFPESLCLPERRVDGRGRSSPQNL